MVKNLGESRLGTATLFLLCATARNCAMQQLRSLLENSRSLTNEQFQGGHEHAGGTGKGGAASAFAADSLAMDVENIAATVSQNGPGADDLLSLPRIERPLDQLELQSRKLWQKTTRSRDGASEARA